MLLSRFLLSIIGILESHNQQNNYKLTKNFMLLYIYKKKSDSIDKGLNCKTSLVPLMTTAM